VRGACTLPKILHSKSFAAVVIIVVFGGTFIAASGATGQLFRSDAPRSNSEDIRTVSISPSGGIGVDSMDVAFNNLLPGTAQSVSINYRNTGNVPESVWVAFPNSTALSSLNSLGNYGAVHLRSSGAGALGDVFDTTNLSDNHQVCGNFSISGCWPLQSQYLIANNIAPGGRGSFSFGFEFASAYSVQPTSRASARWNPYPKVGQTTIKSADGAGAGLPYEIIAVQPGVIPGQPQVITQRNPFADTVTSKKSDREFSDHLKVVGPQGPITYTVTDPNRHLSVSIDGTVTTVGGPLAVGSYSVSGTDADRAGAAGTWMYTLTVANSSGGSSERH
jgi:hypothetical protein